MVFAVGTTIPILPLDGTRDLPPTPLSHASFFVAAYFSSSKNLLAAIADMRLYEFKSTPGIYLSNSIIWFWGVGR